MKKLTILTLLTALFFNSAVKIHASTQPWWEVQAIDTMKFSRDPSREYLTNTNLLKSTSDEQVGAVAKTGATHVVIGTPYDDEFLPVLKTWVAAARTYNLRIWFRGNWSGWEGWFGYSKINRAQHLQKTKEFISKHPDIFEEGDIFSACPECENGGPGDPRQNGDAEGHRKFLIEEYQMMTQAFRDAGRNVQVNFNSMNGDVAKLIMDKQTTQALGGLVVIDHYVKSPVQLNSDVSKMALQSGGKVVLGEFGAPIPDIHGEMTDQQQADWIEESLNLLSKNSDLVGLNYWTGIGGSTAIWTEKVQPKPAVEIVRSFFIPKVVTGTVVNPLGRALDRVLIETEKNKILSDNGTYQLPYISTDTQVKIMSKGHETQQIVLSELIRQPEIVLTPSSPSIWYRIMDWFGSLFR